MPSLRIPCSFFICIYKIHLEMGEAFPGDTTVATRDIVFLPDFSSPPCFQHHRVLFTHTDYLCCYSLFTPPRKLQMLLSCAGWIDPRSATSELNETFRGGTEWMRSFHRGSGSENDFNCCDRLLEALFGPPDCFKTSYWVHHSLKV